MYEKDVSQEFKNYLHNLTKKDRTTSKQAYKRVCISPLRYAGGKSKAIGFLLEHLPQLKEKKIVSPFFGGGSFELVLSQHLGIEVVGYDIFGLLVNFWNVLIHQKSEFISELEKFEITESEFTYNRHVLLNYWEKIKPQDLEYHTKTKISLNPQDLDRLDSNPILQAVYYYYNMTLSYGPMFLGWPSSVEINKDKFTRKIEKLKKIEWNDKLSIQCSSFEHVLEKHQDDFLYLDPPYYLEGDSKMFKPMYPNCNFPIHHKHFNHTQLAEQLKKHKGGFILTYNDCEAIRELYKDFKFEFPTWQYSYGQGEKRIGKNRSESQSNIKQSHEIIIISWPSCVLK
jgi:DNA adenine methylase